MIYRIFCKKSMILFLQIKSFSHIISRVIIWCLISLIFSASPSGFSNPTISPSLEMPKIKDPPSVFANALTLLHQLFGFFSSRRSLLSYSVASPINFLTSIENITFCFTCSFCIMLLFIQDINHRHI